MTATGSCSVSEMSKRTARLVGNVEQAISDAADALLRAEQDREAALSALRTADAGVDEARQVLDRLQRLRASLTADDRDD